MKKVVSAVIAAALVSVLALSLAACNNTPADADEQGTTAAVGVTVEENITEA